MTQAPILLVEDDTSIALVVETVLQAAGYTVQRAENGTDALRAALAAPPSLLIADLNLPGALSGDAVVRTLREEQPELPVIYMSGAFEEGSPQDGLVPGAVTLPKPFRRATLLAAIEEARQWRG